MQIEIKPNEIDIQDIQAVESAVDFFVNNGRYDDAEIFYTRIHNHAQSPDTGFLNQSSSILQRYADALARLGWYIFDRLPQKDIRILFAEHMNYFFDYPWDFVQTELERVLVSIPDLVERDELKHDIQTGMKESLFELGKKNIVVNNIRSLPSIQNWIRDFEFFVGNDTAADILLLTEYLNTSPNVALLASEDRVRLDGLLRFYILISKSSLTPEGNEDVIIFHDITSGHIKYIQRGKEMDTGIESEFVAHMSPEERREAKQKIQNKLKDLRELDSEIRLPVTPILQQQLTRNAELRRIILEDQDAGTSQLPAAPRVTLPTEPAASVAPKKVEPVQVTPPLPPQQLAVKAQPKRTTMPAPEHVEPIQLSKPVTVTASMLRTPSVAPQPIITPAPAPAPVPLPPTPAIVQPTTPRVQSAPMMPQQEAPKPPTPPQKPKEGVDYQSLAELVLAEHALLLASIEAENRFLSLIAAFAKGERTRDEVMATLTAPIESGGVNLTADIAASCLNTAERFRDGAQQRTRRRPQAQETNKKDQPTFQQVTEMMQRHKQFDEARTADKPTQSNTLQKQNNFLEPASVSAPAQQLNTHTGVEDIFANLDVAQMQQKSVTPETDSPIRRIDSIRTQQPNGNGKRRLEQVMGPMEELKKFSLAELRAFGTNPDAATAFIKEKIDLQTQESISKRAEAIRAWQESPLHQLYVQIGNASLTQGTPVNQYIEQRQQSGAETLTAAEFEAISSLNRQLRF